VSFSLADMRSATRLLLRLCVFALLIVLATASTPRNANDSMTGGSSPAELCQSVGLLPDCQPVVVGLYLASEGDPGKEGSR
jgi:hypothetical protein